MGPSRRHDRLQAWSSCDSRVRVDFRSKLGTCRPQAGAQNFKDRRAHADRETWAGFCHEPTQPVHDAHRPGILKAPTLLVDLRGTGGRKHLNHERSSASAGLGAARYSVTDTYPWGDTMRNRIIFEEGSVEAIASLREQDDEFCRRLRIALEMGSEFCPTTVSTKPCTSRPILN